MKPPGHYSTVNCGSDHTTENIDGFLNTNTMFEVDLLDEYLQSGFTSRVKTVCANVCANMFTYCVFFPLSFDMGFSFSLEWQRTNRTRNLTSNRLTPI